MTDIPTRDRRPALSALFPLVMGLGLTAVVRPAAANELRCAELGSNCVASEPLNTNSFPAMQADWGFGAADTSTQEMAISGTPGMVWQCVGGGGLNGVTAETGGAMFDALPNRQPSIAYLIKLSPPNPCDFAGHTFAASAPTARRAFRWYQYFSPDWTLTTGSCLNSGKIFELQAEFGTPLVVTSGGAYQLYGWNATDSPGSDKWCCAWGPGSQAYEFSPASHGGKWWRFEVVVRNASATGATVFELWAKDVTSNGPNVKVLDTSVPGAPGDNSAHDWTQSDADNMSWAQRADWFYATFFRNGTCNGYVGLTHMLAAAWSTDAGQMIGAAVEIEGRSGARIAAPTNLRVF